MAKHETNSTINRAMDRLRKRWTEGRMDRWREVGMKGRIEAGVVGQGGRKNG